METKTKTQKKSGEEAEKTTETETKRPVKTVRSGPIGASIWQETSEGGKDYLAITLSRAWKSQDGEKSGYSHKYFAGNRGDLHKAIDQACDAVEALESGKAEAPQQAAASA